MLKNILLWILAFLLTAGSAVYQRITGPSYPVDGSATVAGTAIDYTLDRSHNGEGDQRVAIYVDRAAIDGIVHYRRYKTGDDYTPIPMVPAGDSLAASLPHQPPAAKLEYYVELTAGDSTVIIPGQRAIVTRFTGAVPGPILTAHIILIFAAMFFSTRTGLQALGGGKTKTLTIWTTLLLLVGGMIFGPVVQKLAFGDLWTGIPFGWDLTDNKTLIAFIVWIIALIRHRSVSHPRYWVIAAAVVTLVIFIIPHSILGSELDYTTGEVKTG